MTSDEDLRSDLRDVRDDVKRIDRTFVTREEMKALEKRVDANESRFDTASGWIKGLMAVLIVSQMINLFLGDVIRERMDLGDPPHKIEAPATPPTSKSMIWIPADKTRAE